MRTYELTWQKLVEEEAEVRAIKKLRRPGKTGEQRDRTFPSAEDIRKRLESRISVDDNGCWNYTKCLDSHGYGNVYFGRVRGAHRLFWIANERPVPMGLCVLHHCDNRRCINLDHLFLGTIKDNNDDRDSKGRSKVPRGEEQHLSKLTESQVTELRTMRSKGATLSHLGHTFGVTKENVSIICLRKTWKHLP